MGTQEEYEEREGTQPYRGHTPMAAIFMFGSLFAAGIAALFGGAALQKHFLASEMEQSKKTVIYETNLNDETPTQSEAYSQYSQRMNSRRR